MAYTKIYQKILKIGQKWFGLHYLDIFTADTRWFLIKTLLSEKLVTPSGEAQFILVNSERIVCHYKYNITFNLYYKRDALMLHVH